MDREAVHEAERDPAALLQRLRGFQIFFILLSVVIGSGIFNNNGQALEVAGPMGLLLCIVIQGVIAAFVGESVSELVQVFPAPNALYAYVESFVDEDLGWIASIAHWYCFAITIPAQMLGAYKLLEYWGPAPYLGPLVFYGITPWALFALNLCGVDYFGWVETIGGVLKLIMVFAISCILYNVSQHAPQSVVDASPYGGPINDGFQAAKGFASNPFTAFCYAVPPVAYSYLGIESTAIAAYEAQSTRSIARPSQTIHWAIFLLCFLCTMGIALTVRWDDHRLPPIWGGPPIGSAHPHDPPSTSATIIAIWGTNINLAGVVNGCLIFSILSSGNTCLYIASRTMYGLTYHLRGTNAVSRYFKRTVGMVWPSTNVPAMALFFSVLLFYWLPFLILTPDASTIDAVIEIITLTAATSCIITWSLLLLAYIRYERWTRKCADGLREQGMDRFIRTSEKYKAWNVLSWFQPWAARTALGGCIFIFICLSATWWTAEAYFAKIAAAYGAHFVFFIVWVLLKIYRFLTKRGEPLQLWVPMEVEPRPRELIKRLRYLERLSVKGADRMRPQFSQSVQGTIDREDSHVNTETRQMIEQPSVGHLSVNGQHGRHYSGPD